MKKIISFVLVLVMAVTLIGCATQHISSEGNKGELISDKQQETPNTVGKEDHTVNETRGAYTYEELCELPAEELLDLFIQNGLVINDRLKQSYTEEELQSLFKEHFSMWHTGVSAFNDTMYLDLAEQTKMVYESIVE